MLLGYNIDFWETHDIEKKLLVSLEMCSWEEDPTHLARITVKARVVDFSEIPLFIVCSEGESFEGESWTCQCEILQATLLGGGPPDEDEPPNGPDDIQPNLFEFFGFGQPSAGPNGGVMGGDGLMIPMMVMVLGQMMAQMVAFRYKITSRHPMLKGGVCGHHSRRWT